MMLKEKERQKVSSEELLEILKRLPITDPLLQREIDSLGDIESAMQRAYEDQFVMESGEFIFTPPVPKKIPEDRIIIIKWYKDVSYPVSHGIGEQSSADLWMKHLKVMGFFNPYVVEDNLWIPHNWYFFRHHLLHGGVNRSGGKLRFYDIRSGMTQETNFNF